MVVSLMDPATSSLIITQALTFLLLVISETLPFSDSPYSGIIQAMIAALQQKQKPVS